MTDAINTTTEATQAAAKPVLTKAEKLAQLDQRIARLQQQRYNVENDIVAAPKVAKAVVLPGVGASILFYYGRTTATTSPELKAGTVVAVKPVSEVNGKKTPAQVKVQVGEGFDAQFVTIYPAQIETGSNDGSAQDAADEGSAE